MNMLGRIVAPYAVKPALPGIIFPVQISTWRRRWIRGANTFGIVHPVQLHSTGGDMYLLERRAVPEFGLKLST